MTSTSAAVPWVASFRPIASAILRSAALASIATLLILLLLPAVLGAAAPQGQIAV